MSFIADIKFKDENVKDLYYTLSESDGKPMVFKTNSRIYSLLEDPEYNSDEIEISKSDVEIEWEKKWK